MLCPLHSAHYVHVDYFNQSFLQFQISRFLPLYSLMIHLDLHLEFYATNDFLTCRCILETNKSDLQNMIVSIKVISATYDRECLMGNRGGVKPSPGNQHLTSKRL